MPSKKQPRKQTAATPAKTLNPARKQTQAPDQLTRVNKIDSITVKQKTVGSLRGMGSLNDQIRK